MSKKQINAISILRCSAGDPRGMHAEVDPYWNAPGEWNENARGDGMSYGGVIEWLERLPEESNEAFYQRAAARADELEKTI